MNRKKRIINILSNSFLDLEISVKDSSNEHIGHNNFDGSQESHFQIMIKYKEKVSMSRLEIHRKINFLLKDEFNNGLHALEIRLTN